MTSVFKKGSKIETELIATENYVDSKIGNVDFSAVEGKINTHEANKANPHGVTKAQVGLSSVLNYGIASKSLAEGGTNNSSYMTPLRTKELFDSINGSPIIDNRDVSPLPKDYSEKRTYNEFKRATVVGLGGKDIGTYIHLFTESAWLDDSGGYCHQTAYSGLSNRIFTRVGMRKTNTWGEWSEIAMHEEIADYLAEFVKGFPAIKEHSESKANPHGVTKAQVGLGSVDNTKQMPISGGTFTGIAKAQNNANYTVAQLRNVIYMEDTGEEPSSSIGNNGDMLIVYEGGS